MGWRSGIDRVKQALSFSPFSLLGEGPGMRAYEPQSFPYMCWRLGIAFNAKNINWGQCGGNTLPVGIAKAGFYSEKPHNWFWFWYIKC
jgi:hypothetical protein